MIHLAALLALESLSSQPLPPVPAAVVQPAPDSAELRQSLRRLVMCIADRRPRWARQTLALPYLSEEQAREAAQALSGRDNCLADYQSDMTFRTSTLVASLAEHFLQAQTDRNAITRAATALNTATPLNASEDFALCVAARDPAAARDLTFSEPGSAGEEQAAQQLARRVEPCTRPGENLTIDVQSFRALIATAFYRALTTDIAARD